MTFFALVYDRSFRLLVAFVPSDRYKGFSTQYHFHMAYMIHQVSDGVTCIKAFRLAPCSGIGTAKGKESGVWYALLFCFGRSGLGDVRELYGSAFRTHRFLRRITVLWQRESRCQHGILSKGKSPDLFFFCNSPKKRNPSNGASVEGQE